MGFSIAALETEEIKQLSILPGLLEDNSVVGLLRVEEQQMPIVTTPQQREGRPRVAFVAGCSRTSTVSLDGSLSNMIWLNS